MTSDPVSARSSPAVNLSAVHSSSSMVLLTVPVLKKETRALFYVTVGRSSSMCCINSKNWRYKIVALCVLNPNTG